MLVHADDPGTWANHAEDNIGMTGMVTALVKGDRRLGARTRDAGGTALAKCRHRLQTVIMPSITIRDVPEETRDELAARAARSGRSLQEYLRAQLIALAARPDAETLIGRVRERKRRTSTSLTAERILRHRDADRR